MNEKQRRFAELYAMSLNATDSAIRAGYSPRTAYSQGNRLLKNAEIIEYLKSITAEATEARIADITEIRETWTEILRGKKNKASDRNKAGELLSKSLGELVDRRQTEVKMAGTIETELKVDSENIARVFMPKMADSAEFTAVKIDEETIVPLPGHEADDVLFYYEIGKPLIESFEWVDPDE